MSPRGEEARPAIQTPFYVYTDSRPGKAERGGGQKRRAETSGEIEGALSGAWGGPWQ